MIRTSYDPEADAMFVCLVRPGRRQIRRDARGGAGDHARSRQRGARDRHRGARSERAHDPGKGRSLTAAKTMGSAGQGRIERRFAAISPPPILVPKLIDPENSPLLSGKDEGRGLVE